MSCFKWRQRPCESPCVLQTTHSGSVVTNSHSCCRNRHGTGHAMSRRLRAAYAATIEPLHLASLLSWITVWRSTGRWRAAGDPDSRCRRELYQLKNLPRSQAPPAPVSAWSNPTATPEKPVLLPQDHLRGNADSEASTRTVSAGDGSESPGRHARLRTNRRGSRAHGSRVGLGYGGVAFETARPEDRGSIFRCSPCADLAPVRVNLLRVYMERGSAAGSRVGCSFVI